VEGYNAEFDICGEYEGGVIGVCLAKGGWSSSQLDLRNKRTFIIGKVLSQILSLENSIILEG
jgi:hypothetical protein